MNYLIKVKEYTTEVDIFALAKDSIYPLDIDFGGSLKIRVDKEFHIINAMDGWGNNLAEEYKDVELEVFLKLPKELIKKIKVVKK